MNLTEQQQQQRRAFEQTLKDNPYDSTTHGVYADWLDEHDMPEYAQLHREWNPYKYDEALERLTRLARECEMNVADLLTEATNYLESNYHLCLPFDTPDEVYAQRRTFWKDYQTVTCNPVPEEHNEDSWIRCGC